MTPNPPITETHEVIGVDLASGPDQSVVNGVIQAPPPEIKFIKKTWHHRLQELNLRKNIVNLMSRSGCSIFKLVPLEENNRVWFSHVTENGVRVYHPHRCTVCLDPAVHKVLMATDASFTSYRCDNDRCKKR